MDLDRELTLKAFQMLDMAIGKRALPMIKLVTGGGASMLLAYGFPGKTTDVDAVPTNGSFEDIKQIAEEVAKALNINHDWLNPHFQAFTIYLPKDSRQRLKRIYSGDHLIVDSLGVEDILIMKLMAGRAKDRPHIRHILKMKPNLAIVENRLQEMKDRNLYAKLATQALDLLDEETSE
jgi:hypothetical protein